MKCKRRQTMTKPCIQIHTKHKTKARTTVLIRKDLLLKAKQLGLNLSQCLENCLKLYIQALENANKQLTSKQTSQLKNKHKKGRERETVGVSWCSGRDLNPRLRLERPEYLAGLYYRSIERSLSIYFTAFE